LNDKVHFLQYVVADGLRDQNIMVSPARRNTKAFETINTVTFHCAERS